MGVKDFLTEYIRNPELYWRGNTRQVSKTLRRFNYISKHYGFDEKSIVSIVISLAEQRINNNTLTIYFPSFGSSGSHLVQDIVANFTPIIPLGELYIAPELIELMQELDEYSKKLFLEAYSLLHCADSSNLYKNVPIVNTVHKPSLQYFSAFSSAYRSCLIIRDPVDIVISRTFRKDEYRSYLNKDTVSDLDYLKDNITKTKSFFKSAINFNHEFILRYEDIISQPEIAAHTLCDILDRPNKLEDMMNAISYSITESTNTNIYVGEKIKVESHFIEFATSELSQIRKSLGYEK